MPSRFLLLPVLAGALACTAKPSDETPPGSAATSDSASEAQIVDVRNAWLAAEKNNDAATVGGFYEDDAVLVTTEGGVARGKAAIQSSLAESFPISDLGSVDSKQLVVSGDIAYDYGEFTQSVTPPKGTAQTVHGHFLVVLHRQSDGSWKITKHVSTTPQTAG